jgi:MFS transporter, ACS family, tartrate transporter
MASGGPGGENPYSSPAESARRAEPLVVAVPLPDGVDPKAVRRKVAWRILPLLCAAYIIAYLDRANAGFAKLQMQDKLHFSDSVFGWGFGIFFVGYLLLEIPGALLVEHWSARKWFARILITWGLCSMGMALVKTPTQFYIARFLLGLAEAGFFPGVVVFLTHWFTRAERARAMAALVIGIPIGLAFGSQVSSFVISHELQNLSGWQLVFIVEGAPAVLLGLMIPWLLPDRPHDAPWLTPDESRWLEDTLKAEREAAARVGHTTLLQAFRNPTVWLLSFSIMAANTGGYALLFWLPTAMKGFLIASGHVPADASSDVISATVLNWLVPVYLCGIVGVWLSGRSSDRTGEHKWHCAFGMIGVGVFLIASIIPGQSWGMVFFWLCCTLVFCYVWPPPFWVLPTLTLSSSAAAVSIGFINICANLSGLIGSPIVGSMKDHGLSDSACLVFLACCYILGGVIVSIVSVPKIKIHETRGPSA